jgi:DNA-binding transcriptional LysR family regulator
MVLALPESHPLASSQQLALTAVLDEPLVMFPRRILPSVHDAILALYHAAGRSPQVAQEAIQMQTIVNLVSAGLGVAWVPASVRQFQRPGVMYRPLKPLSASIAGIDRKLTLPICDTSLVWRDASVAPALDQFIRFAKAQ